MTTVEEYFAAQKQGPAKPYPWNDGAVNENAAIRVIRMVKAECPVDPTPEIRQKDGSYKPNPRFTGEQNCQQLYKLNNNGKWDVAKCIEIGHDPYHTELRRTIVDDVINDDGEVVDQRTKILVEKRLNVIQVSLNVRHNTGRDMELAVAYGARPLEDFGYITPCEFRNCVKPKQVKTRYGEYCSERHARLVAADARGIFLPVGGDAYTEDKATQERNDILENLNIGVHG